MARFIAHRAGNDLTRLRQAEQLGFELVEADVRLWRHRPEVRHLKTLGPIPILWDRWRLANPFTPRLVIARLLDAVGPDTELMLDLKGRNTELTRLVLAELAKNPRPITVCARSWRLLEPFVGRHDVRVVYSVGTRRELRTLLRRFRDRQIEGVSIHERLLDASTAAELRRLAATVLSWPVNTLERARELSAIGIDGLISDNLALAQALPR
jgi:glycerophosphoryl diester phosphodiesterase